MTHREDGYRLWLRYEPLADSSRLERYRAELAQIALEEASPPSPTLHAARRELERGLAGLLGRSVSFSEAVDGPGGLVVGTPRSSRAIASLGLEGALAPLGREGFTIRRAVLGGQARTVLAANDDIGILYGAFHLLRHLQTQRDYGAILTDAAPTLAHRMLDHWDNLDGTIERGYAGFSIWDWHKLPDYLSPQYEDYARASASVGLNGAVLTNVNADALVLTAYYLRKIAALAGVFRPYGVRVYLPARFSAPIEIGGLRTADPLDGSVIRFWREKAAEIYRHIPDFGGFVVKANSEGQPGPGDYGRTHAEGANVLADALGPHGGIVLWRAFVYANDGREDRAKQAFRELQPLDGQFRENVALQVKNGPIDFQPREPFHPLFGAMPRTALVAEFMLTQEYLGFATHLVYLGTLFQETLDSDTHTAGAGSTVASVIKGAGADRRLTGMAGVANIGTDRNWCGHPFAQSNWFAFGRLAWDPLLRAEAIADDWIRMTFTNDERFVAPVLSMMLASREAVVDYMTPLGLHHLMAWDHHYGPGPWISKGRADWTSVYYHRADAAGIGFDRSATGSDAVSQYAPPVRARFGGAETCPEALLLWFHHVPWDRPMHSGRTLWEELCHRYDAGVSCVRRMRASWASLEGLIDPGRHAHVGALLRIQEKEAEWWRDACVLYFQTFSRRPLPAGYEVPARTLDEYIAIRHHHVPGIPESSPPAPSPSSSEPT
jgi:alpha-glucuronidase